jgi:hypothetical protein
MLTLEEFAQEAQQLAKEEKQRAELLAAKLRGCLKSIK